MQFQLVYLTLFLAGFSNCEVCTKVNDYNPVYLPEYHDSSSQCKDLTLESGYDYCCYVHIHLKCKSLDSESKYCALFTKDTYETIEKYINDRINEGVNKGCEVKKYSIDCKANYLSRVYLVLLLFLLL